MRVSPSKFRKQPLTTLGFGISILVVKVPAKTSSLTFALPLSPLSKAEGFKEQGNVFYSKKDYSEAFNYYTKAIGKRTSSVINHFH